MLLQPLLARTVKSPKKVLVLFPLLAFLSLPSILNADKVQAYGATVTASLNPSSAVVNTDLGINLSLVSQDNLNDGIVDVEIYNANNQKTFQKFFEHQNLSNNQTVNYDLKWHPQNSGKYTIKTGVFSNTWSENFYWADQVAQFDVNNQSSTASDTNNPEKCGMAASTPSSSGFTLTVNPKTSYSDAIVDVEVYNSAGNRLYQHFFEHQNLAANQSSSFNVNWNKNTDDFVIKTGIFSNGWSQLYFWSDKVNMNGPAAPVATNTPAPQVTAAPTTAPVNESGPSIGGGAYTVGADGRIYKNGQKITLSGISWFGAETSTMVPHGLWQRGYKDMISQMKSLGFNAVRLPYCPAAVQNSEVSGIDAVQNSDLVGLKSMDVMDKIVKELNDQHMFILMDNHRPDCNAQSDLWYTGSYSEDQWVNDLTMLANRYKNLEYFVGLDLKNEPKGSATWGTGNAATDWDMAVEKAGKSILAANPNVLLFVDGIENNPTCSNNSLGHWWGGNLEPVACKDLNPNIIPANKVVFAPHAYGPDTFVQSYFSGPNFPGNMPAIWDQHFGFLKDKGKAIAIGEYGGKYGSGNPLDVTWQDAFVNYLSSKGICDNFYWDWNPNSGDTGGILKDDWTSVNQGKVDLLAKYRSQCK